MILKNSQQNYFRKNSNRAREQARMVLERFKLATESHSRNKNYQFWQYGNHAEEIYTVKFMRSKLDYIHMNPVRAGIVEKASDYIYSSASNYVHDEGIVQIEKMENPIVDVLKSWLLTKYNLY